MWNIGWPATGLSCYTKLVMACFWKGMSSAERASTTDLSIAVYLNIKNADIISPVMSIVVVNATVTFSQLMLKAKQLLSWLQVLNKIWF